MRGTAAFATVCVVAFCFVGCGERERLTSDGSGDPTLPEWVYGESQVYDAPAMPDGRIVDPLTGQTFRFPAGGSGLLTVLQLESGPHTASDEGAFEVSYEGSGSLELLIDHDPEDVDFLVGYLPLDYAVQEGEELDTSGWLPLRSTAGQGDTLVFELPVGVKKAGSMSLPWSGVKKFKPVRYKKGTANEVLFAQIEQNVRDAMNSLINALPAARRAAVMAAVNGAFEPVLYVPANRSAYLFTSKPKYVPYWDSFGLVAQCAIVIPDDATTSVAHEVGHYLHHVLLGNSGYLIFFQHARPSGHHVGMPGALNELIEEPAYFSEYYLKGTVSGAGPEKGTFLTNGGGSISPISVDYRDLEGMTVAMLASVIRDRDEIRDYANRVVKVPVVQGSREQLWQDCYEIIASGTSGVLAARDKIETLLQNSGQADKLPAMLQAIGWNHHVVCRFVDGNGNPLSGVTARAISKVGSMEYRLPARSRESDGTGTYGLSEFFPGANTLRIYYDGDSTDVPKIIPWTTPTNQQVDFGDISVVSDELLRKLHRCQHITFRIQARHLFSDGEQRDRHFEHHLYPLTWNGSNFSVRDTIDSYGFHGVMISDGNVEMNGMILNAEYTYDWTNDQSGNTHTESHIRVVVTGLPYTSDYLNLGHQHVRYTKEAAEAVPYITLMEATYTQSVDGTVTQSWSYISTNWSHPDATSTLDMEFHE